jgi:hypothetical protein
VQCQVIRTEKKRAEWRRKHCKRNREFAIKDVVERMKIKYANIDIDEEIDMWLGVSNEV